MVCLEETVGTTDQRGDGAFSLEGTSWVGASAYEWVISQPDCAVFLSVWIARDSLTHYPTPSPPACVHAIAQWPTDTLGFISIPGGVLCVYVL